MSYYLAVFTFNPVRDSANVFFISFLCHISLIPEVYEIKAESSEPFDEFDSQEQHVFVLENNHNNGSATMTDLIQMLYKLFSTGEMMMEDKEEAHSGKITAPANDKQQDKKGNLEYSRTEDAEVLCLDFLLVKDEEQELIETGRDDEREGLYHLRIQRVLKIRSQGR